MSKANGLIGQGQGRSLSNSTSLSIKQVSKRGDMMERLIRAFSYSVIFAMISLLSVSFLWEKPVQLTLVLMLVAGIMLLMMWDKLSLLLFAFSGITGALAEALAISFGAWNYPKSNIIGIPLWLPVLWGIATLFIHRITQELHDYLEIHKAKKKSKK